MKGAANEVFVLCDEKNCQENIKKGMKSCKFYEVFFLSSLKCKFNLIFDFGKSNLNHFTSCVNRFLCLSYV